ncbi:hypothetical protein G7046_g6732 [Stylonectria norvegica]|nr:hypothetical protein G7046_g6732 [Stylonectria norvegica]
MPPVRLVGVMPAQNPSDLPMPSSVPDSKTAGAARAPRTTIHIRLVLQIPPWKPVETYLLRSADAAVQLLFHSAQQVFGKSTYLSPQLCAALALDHGMSQAEPAGALSSLSHGSVNGPIKRALTTPTLRAVSATAGHQLTETPR